ncbi:MAG TPA: fatty acid cis/trans isomerase [Polyangiales bacterium]|nr:fatty acid cis/trans isomerase [Polyangiales bacterium]
MAIKAALSCYASCVVLAACTPATPVSRLPDPRSGYAAIHAPASRSQGADVLWQAASQVFERRCVVCHGCYDAPCQLKLESMAGAERGGTKTQVYEAERLSEAEPTRLFIDAQTTAEWRAKGFHGVLPEREQPDPERSVMLRMLQLKQQHPLTPAVDLDKSFTFTIEREQTCTDAEHFDDYAREHPLWGMPYALPQLEPKAHATLVDWLKAGAPAGKPSEPAPEIARAIREWEEFFNEPSLKQRLVSRYIFEHLFVGSLYFKGLDDRSFFRLVRSRTPSGYAVDEIPTRRPFEDPGEGPFYYRFVVRMGVPLAKTHMPYALDAARMERYRELFLKPEYKVEALPSYEPAVASNPFKAFEALPIASRYRFLLDDAEFTMMGFIKGPVCRGQAALSVIQERFWITFAAPTEKLMAAEAQLLRETVNNLELPAQAGSNAVGLSWFSYSKQHDRYVQQKNALLTQELRAGKGVRQELIWDGEGVNQNAALTVFRHYDSATVVKGLVGGPPKTAWVIDYALFERIHYLLVAGFDAFGNVGHQLMTRLYMDFLRMEGEANLLLFLPNARRKPLVDAWYQRMPVEVKERVYSELTRYTGEPNIQYKSSTPEQELYTWLSARLDKVRSHRYLLEGDWASTQLRALDGLHGLRASFFPETSILIVVEPNGAEQYFSLLRDSALTNVAQLFDEEDRRVPAEDALCVVPGILGAYPNQFFKVTRAELPAFIEQVHRLGAAAGYAELRKRFGVSRANPSFWSISDGVYDGYRRREPLEAGLLDYNRLLP